VGSDHCRNALRCRLHYGRVRQVASRQRTGRLPNDQGFDEWYGIPRTTDEAFWPSDPAAKARGVPFEHIMEGRKGQKSQNLAAMIWSSAG
jgi:hypothetical protein